MVQRYLVFFIDSFIYKKMKLYISLGLALFKLEFIILLYEIFT